MIHDDVYSSDTKIKELNTQRLNDHDESLVMTTPSSITHLEGDSSGDEVKEMGARPLETVLELTDGNIIEMNNLNELPSTLQSPKSLNNVTPVVATQPPSATTSSHRPRNRTDSLRVITDKFRSISNDLLRSIESAHEMIDLNRSHFSAATQSAAAQQYQSSENYLTPNLTSNGGNQQFSKWPRVKKEFLSHKHHAKTVPSGDPASDLTVKSVDSPDTNNNNNNNNDINSILPSTSLSSYGLVNEQENLNANKFYSLNRKDSTRNEKKANDLIQSNTTTKDLSKNESRDDVSTKDESSYYSPKSK